MPNYASDDGLNDYDYGSDANDIDGNGNNGRSVNTSPVRDDQQQAIRPVRDTSEAGLEMRHMSQEQLYMSQSPTHEYHHTIQQQRYDQADDQTTTERPRQMSV